MKFKSQEWKDEQMSQTSSSLMPARNKNSKTKGRISRDKAMWASEGERRGMAMWTWLKSAVRGCPFFTYVITAHFLVSREPCGRKASVPDHHRSISVPRKHIGSYFQYYLKKKTSLSQKSESLSFTVALTSAGALKLGSTVSALPFQSKQPHLVNSPRILSNSKDRG